MLPQIDGLQIIEKVRSQNINMPIIILSAKRTVDDRVEGLRIGSDDYLVKPTTPKELLRRVETQLERATGMKRTSGLVLDEPEEAEEGVDNIDELLARGSTKVVESIISGPLKESAKPGTQPKSPVAGTIPLPTVPDNAGIIAVLGSRGGSGTTTVAINLAVALADAGQPTTLVDLDQAQGHIAIYLRRQVTRSINGLAMLNGALLQARVEDYLIYAGKNLKLLLTQPNLDGELPVLRSDQVDDLLVTLAKPGHYTVFDLGQSLTSVNRAILTEAAHVLLCVQPDRASLIMTRDLIRQLQSMGIKQQLQVLLLDFRARGPLPQEALQQFLAYHLSQVIIISDIKLSQAVNRGQPVIHAFPNSEISAAFRTLAQKVMVPAPASLSVSPETTPARAHHLE